MTDYRRVLRGGKGLGGVRGVGGWVGQVVREVEHVRCLAADVHAAEVDEDRVEPLEEVAVGTVAANAFDGTLERAEGQVFGIDRVQAQAIGNLIQTVTVFGYEPPCARCRVVSDFIRKVCHVIKVYLLMI